MARIMCTRHLWQRLGNPGLPPSDASSRLIPGASLGPWAAKAFRYNRRDLVIGLEERTYLTVVFPLAPRSQFRASFASAVANALADLGIAQAVADAESAAIAFGGLVRLTSRSMAGSLNDLEFQCGIELEYHDDLRRVQRNLNDMPHARRDPCVPVDAVRQLLSAARPFGAVH